MKKTKAKSEQKTVKKTEKKDARKVARKELSSNLSAKFKEVIQSLGHEAEVIAKDIEKAGKFLSKKLSDKKIKKDAASSSLIKTLDSAIEQVKDKSTESAVEIMNGDMAPEKPKASSTRRTKSVAKTEASQNESEGKARSVRKPSQSGPKKASATTTRSTKLASDSNSEEVKPESEQSAQKEETNK